MAEETIALHQRAKRQPKIDSRAAELILTEIQTGAGSAHLRSHLKTWIGPVWTKRVFGF